MKISCVKISRIDSISPRKLSRIVHYVCQLIHEVRGKNFHNAAKFTKVFTRECFRLYGIKPGRYQAGYVYSLLIVELIARNSHRPGITGLSGPIVYLCVCTCGCVVSGPTSDS